MVLIVKTTIQFLEKNNRQPSGKFNKKTKKHKSIYKIRTKNNIIKINTKCFKLKTHSMHNYKILNLKPSKKFICFYKTY